MKEVLTKQATFHEICEVTIRRSDDSDTKKLGLTKNQLNDYILVLVKSKLPRLAVGKLGDPFIHVSISIQYLPWSKNGYYGSVHLGIHRSVMIPGKQPKIPGKPTKGEIAELTKQIVQVPVWTSSYDRRSCNDCESVRSEE